MYPLPRIGETIKKLEVFQYATALDLNRWYYTIRISTASQDITRIVTELGKLRYNSLPMGMWSSGYIFQAKADATIGDIEGVKTHINDVLVLIKESFSNHIEQLRIIFGRLRAAGVKLNDTKCIFGLKDITYLGYVITRKGIKPDPNKVQGIMDLGQPTKTNELQVIILMLQYYSDMWTR